MTGCIRDNSCRPARDLSEFVSKDRCSPVVGISLRSLHFLLLSSRLLQTYLQFTGPFPVRSAYFHVFPHISTSRGLYNRFTRLMDGGISLSL